VATLTITATPDPTSRPPSIRLDVQDAGTPAIPSTTLYRLDPDGRNRKVRTADDGPLVISGGVGTVIDYEVPLGSTVTYVTSQAGGPTVDASVDSDQAWLVDPGSPAQSVQLDLRRGSNSEEQWAIDQGSFAVLGRSTPIVVTSGARTAPSSTLITSVPTLAQLSAFRSLLSGGAPLLLNVPPQLGLGIDTAYISVGNVSVSRPSDVGSEQLRDLTLPYQVVDRPAGGTQAAITWNDIAAKYPTWAAVAASARSWSELANPTT
jgi:hypothetical protein